MIKSLEKVFNNLPNKNEKDGFIETLRKSLFLNQSVISLEDTYDKGLYYVYDHQRKLVKPINALAYQAIQSFLWENKFVYNF